MTPSPSHGSPLTLPDHPDHPDQPDQPDAAMTLVQHRVSFRRLACSQSSCTRALPFDPLPFDQASRWTGCPSTQRVRTVLAAIVCCGAVGAFKLCECGSLIGCGGSGYILLHHLPSDAGRDRAGPPLLGPFALPPFPVWPHPLPPLACPFCACPVC